VTVPRVLVLDNYDSFVGMLYQILGELGAEPVLVRNDEVAPRDVVELGATHLVISPGPRTPADAGASVGLVRRFANSLPILGVCLGHQAIGAAFGAAVVPARRLVHGKTSPIHHDGRGVLRGLPSPFAATRYHSLALDRATLPEDLVVSAWTDDGEVMAVRREGAPVLAGVQFHPESVLTEHGRRILANFLEVDP
jgi:anthranilate synthase component 2